MASSNATAGSIGSAIGRYFVSAKNQVGMVLAILVIVLHLVVGLGDLWPVAALAAYGAGAALAPAPKRRELTESQPTPVVLEESLRRTSAQLAMARPPREVMAQSETLQEYVRFVLAEWDHLEPTPEHRQTIWNVVQVYYPEVVKTYLEAPQYRDPAAVSVVVDSLSTLTRAAWRIRQGILDDNLRAMDSQAQFLRQELGDLPGLDDSYHGGAGYDPRA